LLLLLLLAFGCRFWYWLAALARFSCCRLLCIVMCVFFVACCCIFCSALALLALLQGCTLVRKLNLRQ
jgi:hypothetical protein